MLVSEWEELVGIAFENAVLRYYCYLQHKLLVEENICKIAFEGMLEAQELVPG